MPAIITSYFREFINVPANTSSELVFDQTTPSDTWNIVHNLNFHPNVIVVDTDGNIVSGNVQYLSITTVQIKFVVPFIGTAYLR